MRYDPASGRYSLQAADWAAAHGALVLRARCSETEGVPAFWPWAQVVRAAAEAGIIAVPLVGTLDSARTQVVMEKLLDSLMATGAAHAVIDITGVPTVDTEVAQHLLKTVNAARLLGAQCTISGIRPQVAQTIVALGIEFGDIATKATLADALALALRQAGLKVVPAS